MSDRKTHQCSMSRHCKSTTCPHAKPHDPRNCDCDRPAPCGCWPDHPEFQPTVRCVPLAQVTNIEPCPRCGMAESKEHHPTDCANELLRQLKEIRGTQG